MLHFKVMVVLAQAISTISSKGTESKGCKFNMTDDNYSTLHFQSLFYILSERSSFLCDMYVPDFPILHVDLKRCATIPQKFVKNQLKNLLYLSTSHSSFRDIGCSISNVWWFLSVFSTEEKPNFDRQFLQVMASGFKTIIMLLPHIQA